MKKKEPPIEEEEVPEETISILDYRKEVKQVLQEKGDTLTPKVKEALESLLEVTSFLRVAINKQIQKISELSENIKVELKDELLWELKITPLIDNYITSVEDYILFKEQETSKLWSITKQIINQLAKLESQLPKETPSEPKPKKDKKKKTRDKLKELIGDNGMIEISDE